jgi:hypothetical protein
MKESLERLSVGMAGQVAENATATRAFFRGLKPIERERLRRS